MGASPDDSSSAEIGSISPHSVFLAVGDLFVGFGVEGFLDGFEGLGADVVERDGDVGDGVLAAYGRVDVDRDERVEAADGPCDLKRPLKRHRRLPHHNITRRQHFPIFDVFVPHELKISAGLDDVASVQECFTTIHFRHSNGSCIHKTIDNRRYSEVKF